MPRRGSILLIALLASSAKALAGTENLSISTQVAFYPEVIQGGEEDIEPEILNLGTEPGTYTEAATYGPNQVSLGSYSGTLEPNTDLTNNFPLDTADLPPAAYSVSATLQDTTPGSTAPAITVNSQFTVEAHAAPAIDLQDEMLPLTDCDSPPVQFETQEIDPNSLAQAPPSGTDAAATFAPQMIGDPPPNIPTADLDLDSITSTGSPYITTTLQPFIDLFSDDNPAEGLPFQVYAFVPSLGDYSTTFTLHYSDEQDLPAANGPGSQAASFTVAVDMTATTADWTVTVVPEPSSFGLLTIIGLASLGRGNRLRQMCRG